MNVEKFLSFECLLQSLSSQFDAILLLFDVIFWHVQLIHERLLWIYVDARICGKASLWRVLPGYGMIRCMQSSGDRLKKCLLFDLGPDRLQYSGQINIWKFCAITVARFKIFQSFLPKKLLRLVLCAMLNVWLYFALLCSDNCDWLFEYAGRLSDRWDEGCICANASTKF